MGGGDEGSCKGGQGRVSQKIGERIKTGDENAFGEMAKQQLYF